MSDDAPNLAQQRQKEAREDLVGKLGAKLAPLQKLNARHRIANLVVFGGLLVFSARCPFGPLSLLAAVTALNAFVLLVHEGMHGLLWSNPRANRWCSVALGGFVLISHTAYKVMHGRHHRFLGDCRDPDDYENYSKSPRIIWAMHYLRLALGSFLYLVLIPFLALRHGSLRERRDILAEYAVLATSYAILFLAADRVWLWQHWLLPLVMVGLFTNLRGLTQHGISDSHDPYLASRSIHLHPALAFLLLNENLHLEHHLFPEVPSYHLPQLHRLIYRTLPRAVVNHSYGEFLRAFFLATPRMDRTPIGLTDPQQAERSKTCV